MNFGKADRYITIKKATVDNSGSEPKTTYATIVSAWAKRTYAPGSEQTQADQKVGVQNCLYEMRHFEGIEQHMIVYDGIDYSTWEILSAEFIGRDDFIRLTCSKRDNQNNEN